MEVVLEGSEGVPEGAVLSIKFGDTKRQALASKVGQPFRFPGSPADPLPLKVELLVPAAPIQLVSFEPSVAKFDVDFGNGIKVNLSQREVSELQRPAVNIGAAAEARGLHSEKLAMAQQAASYLEEHDLVRMFQDILHTLLIAKPEDPHAFVEERMARAKKMAEAKNQPEVAALPTEAGLPADQLSQSERGSARARKGPSVRENMRAAGSKGAPNKVEALIMTLQSAHDQLPMVLPFLPKQLRDDLCCEELAAECQAQFQALDREGKGNLTPIEMLPVIVRLSQDKVSVIDEDACMRFVEMFDANEDGVISFNEFTGLVQFVIVVGFLESEEGKSTIQLAKIEETAFQEFISMVEEDKERLWSIIPFLPEWLVEHVCSEEFLMLSLKNFDELDKDGNGTLEPEELLPLIVNLSEELNEEHPLAIDMEKCRRFTKIFDVHGNGVIMRDEFIEFAQFLTVMNYLASTQDGSQIKQLSAADASRERTSFHISLLENSGRVTSEVLAALPKALTGWINTKAFTVHCQAAFVNEASRGEGPERSSLSAEELYPAVCDLCQNHPFDVLADQYADFAAVYLQAQGHDPKGGLDKDQFPDLARFAIILAYLYFTRENAEMLLMDVLMGQEKINQLLSSLRDGVDKIAELAPFLPQDLIDDLLSEEFAQRCKEDFDRLDENKSGVLEPDEIMPIMRQMTEAHKLAFTEESCRHFVDIFDAEKNGHITEADFVNFSRFMMIMAFMETDEGLAVEGDAEVELRQLGQDAAEEVAKQSDGVEALLQMLEADRHGVHKVIPLLPKHIYESMVSDEFVIGCKKRFVELDQDKTNVLRPWELLPIVVELSAASPVAVTDDQCQRFTAIFDIHGDGVLRVDEFLDFSRFICIMSYLHTPEGREAAAGSLDILRESKDIEDLLQFMEEDRSDMFKVIPYLPDGLRTQIMSVNFTEQCLEFFTGLDKDGNGSLDALELYPVVLALSEAHEAALDIQQCERFAAIFDDEGTGVISKDEFVNFARFLIIMGHLRSGSKDEFSAADVMDKAIELSDQLIPTSTPQASKQALALAAGPSRGEITLLAPDTVHESRIFLDALLSTGTDRIAEALCPSSPPHLVAPHLAVDAEYYQQKSDKLSAENETLREQLHSLETTMRRMEASLEAKDRVLRHAEVDLKGSGAAHR